MKKTVYIDGMMCAHCTAHVQKALEALEGVKSAEVSHTTGTAVVTLENEISDDVLKQAVTFVFVCFAFLIFRAETVPAMMGMLGAMFSGKFGEIGIFPFFQLDEIMLPMKFLHLDSLPYAAYYPMAFFFLVTGYLVFVGKNAEQRVAESKNSVFSAIGTSLLLLYCILSMGGVNTFLYFNF